MTIYALERLSNDEYDQYETIAVFTSEAAAQAYGDRIRPVMYPYDKAGDWYVLPFTLDPDAEFVISALPPKAPEPERPKFVVDHPLTALTLSYMVDVSDRFISTRVFPMAGEVEK